jgi:hypothetical protein
VRINPVVYGLVVLVVFMGVILGFQRAGIWSVSGKVTATGERVQPSAADVNTIKGWMTLEQVSTAFGIPVIEILSAFDLPADTPPSAALKDLESESFDITSLRTWLADQRQIQP